MVAGFDDYVSDSEKTAFPGTVALVGPIRVDPLRPWLDGTATHLPPGRGGTPVTQLATGLLARGHSVVVVSLDHRIATEVCAVGPRLRLCLGPYRPRHRARDAFRVERGYISHALRREAPILAHAHWTYEYALGALASGVPTIVTVRDWAPTILRLHPTPYRLVRLGMNAVALARAQTLTVASPYMANLIRRWRRVEPVVIPNAIADDCFRCRGHQANLAAPTLMAVNSGFSKRKNVTGLIETFHLVREQVPGARLHLLGSDHEQGGPAQRWASTRGLDEGIEFLGPRPHTEVIERLREAALFVHPSLEESFGMVVVEAMSQGTPVVGGRRSGAVPWVLGGGSAGLLVDVRRPLEFANGIVGILTNPALWWQLSVSAFTHAKQHFGLRQAVDSHLALYRETIQGKRI